MAGFSEVPRHGYAAHRPAYPVAIVEFVRHELALAPPALAFVSET